MATKSIGSSGRDYSTLSAWASYVNVLALTAPEVGEMYNDSEFTESAAVTIGGWSGGSSTNTITLTTGPGQSFRDNANVQTNALRYNHSNGVGVKMTGTYTASKVNVTGSNFVLSNIQFASTASNAQDIIDFNSSNANVTVQNLIVQGRTWRNDMVLVRLFLKTNSVVQNVAVILTSTLGNGVILESAGTGATSVYDLTVVSSNGAAGIGIDCTYTPAAIVKNCAVYGFATDYAGTASASSGNNATDKSSFGGTNFGTSGQTSITSSEWVSVASGSEDLRLSTGSTKLKDNGATAGPTYDIAGTTRPQGSAYDIGCWELIQFKPAWAQGQGVIGDTSMYLKNTAGQYLGFALINATNGSALTGATVTARLSIDGGAQATVTGTVSELGNGQYLLAMSQADTNGNDITFLFTATGAVPVQQTIVTEASTSYRSQAQYITGDMNLTSADVKTSNIIDATSAGLSVTAPPFANLSAPQSDVAEFKNGNTNTYNVWSENFYQCLARVKTNGVLRIDLMNSTATSAVWAATDRANLDPAICYRSTSIMNENLQLTGLQTSLPAPFGGSRVIGLSSTFFVGKLGGLGSENVAGPDMPLLTRNGTSWDQGIPTSSSGRNNCFGAYIGLVKIGATSFAAIVKSADPAIALSVASVTGTGTGATATIGTAVDWTSTQGGWSGVASVTFLVGSAGNTLYWFGAETDGSSHYRVSCRIYTVSGTTLTYSSTVIIATMTGTNTVAYLSVTSVDPAGVEGGNAVVVYADGAAPNTYKVCAFNAGTARTVQTLTTTKIPLSAGQDFRWLICASATKFIAIYNDFTVQNFDLDFSIGTLTNNTAYNLNTMLSALSPAAACTAVDGVRPIKNETSNVGICIATLRGYQGRGGQTGSTDSFVILQFSTSGASTSLVDAFRVSDVGGFDMVPLDLTGSPNKYLLLGYGLSTNANSQAEVITLLRNSNVWAINSTDKGGCNGTPIFS